MKKIWSCKIGEVDGDLLPPGSDFPMRQAIQKAYFELTGRNDDFLFSGWDAELMETERIVANAQKAKVT